MQYYKSKTEIKPRRVFDPANTMDQQELAYFMKNKKWRNGCPFFLEFPYSDIPAMCMAKFTEYKLTTELNLETV